MKKQNWGKSKGVYEWEGVFKKQLLMKWNVIEGDRNEAPIVGELSHGEKGRVIKVCKSHSDG